MVRSPAELPPRGGRHSQRLQGLVVPDHQQFRPELADFFDKLLLAGFVGYHAHVHLSDGLGAQSTLFGFAEADLNTSDSEKVVVMASEDHTSFDRCSTHQHRPFTSIAPTHKHHKLGSEEESLIAAKPTPPTMHELTSPSTNGLTPTPAMVDSDVLSPTAAIAVPSRGSERWLPTPTTRLSHWAASSTPRACPQLARVTSPADRAADIPARFAL
eukprot:9398371-Pyramimonas_sp.AAC.1